MINYSQSLVPDYGPELSIVACAAQDVDNSGYIVLNEMDGEKTNFFSWFDTVPNCLALINCRNLHCLEDGQCEPNLLI